VSLSEHLIHDLAETFSASGDAFFRILVLQIVKALGLDFAIVVEIDAAGAETARTVAMCDRGQIIDNFEYPVAGTPCEETLRSGVLATHPRDLARLFPNAPFVMANGFESYIGIPLQDERGEILGLLAVLHRGPIEDMRLTQSLLRILAARAAAELERTRVGERIRRSRDAYLEVLDDFPTPIWRSDLKGRCDFFNRAWLEFRGRTLAQELGTGFVEGMPEEDLERLRSRFLLALREQKPFEIEGRLRRHDGELRTFVDVGRPYLDAEGRFAGFVGACYDITDRLRAEDSAREARQFLDTLLENAPTPIFTRSLDNRYLQVNRSWERLSGRRREDAVGRPVEEIFEPDLAARFRRQDRAIAESGKPMTTEDLIVGPQGERWLRTVRFPAREGSGQVCGVTGISLDVTESRHAEDALRESEARYRLVADNTADVIWVVDPTDFRLTYVSPSVLKVRGFTVEEALAQPLEERLTPASRLAAMQTYADVLSRVASGELSPDDSMTMELEFTKKDGGTIWTEVNTRFLRDESGRITGILGASRDIGERKKAEERLRASESRFRRLIERVPDAIVVEHGGRIVFANPSAARLLGWEHPGDLLGEPILSLVHPEEREEIMEMVRRAVHAGEPSTPGEYRCVRREGSIGYGEFQAIPIEFDGKPSILVVGRDVTERREMQAQLLQADRLAALGTLAAGVAHEMNNPLSYVLSNLKFLSEELPRFRQEARWLERDAHILPADEDQQPPEKVRWRDVEETLAEAIEGAERVRVIVRDLKTFTRVNDEMQDSLDVRKVLDSIINVAWHEIHPRATLRRDYQDVPPLQASEGRLGQVFLNLLVNAAQALPLGGDHRNEIRVATKTDAEGNAVVEIQDTGPGIPPEILPRIFDPFFTTKPVGQGTGLGLSICHHLVTTFGGSIRIESWVGQGTCVRVTLPAAAHSP